MSMTSVASITSEKKQLTFIDIAEKAKFYTSLCLGTTAFLSVFAFLFLIPFIVDPAISSLMADYEAEPVTCIVTQHVYAEGISNCSWASCREGCTREVTRCHQIYVNYSKTPFREYRPHKIVEWDVVDTHFLINTEGCGYPPSVNCSEFSQQYGYSTAGTPFPCYYSRTYPDVQVVARYSWEDTLRHLVLSITIPNLLFAASIGILTYWYCPGCKRSCQKYIHHFPTEYGSKTEERSSERNSTSIKINFRLHPALRFLCPVVITPVPDIEHQLPYETYPNRTRIDTRITELENQDAGLTARLGTSIKYGRFWIWIRSEDVEILACTRSVLRVAFTSLLI